MTLAEAKRKIKSLGFEEDSTMDEYDEIVCDSLDRAVQYIYDSTVRLMIPYYTRELSTPEHYDLSTDTEVTEGKAYYSYNESANKYVLVIPLGTENPSEEGWYEYTPAFTWTSVRPDHITVDTEDTADLGLPADLTELVPLLAGYHIWLDDDQTKATMYYNNFVQKRDAIIESNMSTARATIMPTIDGVKWFGIGW